MQTIQLYPFELFKEVEFDESLKLRYAISKKGRLVSYINDILKGRELKGGLIEGYRVFRYKIYRDGKKFDRHKMFARLVAENFLPQPAEDQILVMNIDFNKTNIEVENLKWVTREELLAHSQASPLSIEARRKIKENNISPMAKLNVAKVRQIKRMLNSVNQTRQKMIAKQFGVSATQIKRIARGENWTNVVV